MITRWEEICRKVADRLELEYDQVIEIVQDMAQKTSDHASHPTVMETDLLGIGSLQARYGKLQARQKLMPHISRNKKKWMKMHEESGLSKAEKAKEKLSKEISLIERDELVFCALLRQKEDIYKAGGRLKYIAMLIEAREKGFDKLNLSEITLATRDPKLHKKIYISEKAQEKFAIWRDSQVRGFETSRKRKAASFPEE
jgi:hypothetical protein